MNDHHDTPSFNDWQKDFCRSLLGELTAELQQTFYQNTSEKSVSIYQNNVFYSLSNALGDLYPVIKKLVGDDFFTGTATYYIRSSPPQQAAMVHFGKDFPDFLRQFEHTQTMPYLADVAELELAWHQAYHAADTTSLTPEDFSSLDAEALSNTSLTFHPSLQLVDSNYPILTIWQANQEGGNNTQNIDLNEPQRVLVVRPVYDVLLFSIDEPVSYFIQCLKDENSIQNAIEETLQCFHNFDISQAIQFLIQECLVVQRVTHNN